MRATEEVCCVAVLIEANRLPQRSITATVSPSGELTGPRHSRPARSFYEHLIPEFERSPTDPLHLLPR